MSSPRSVAIIAGWAEGSWQTRKFSAALEHAGYTFRDSKSADVIIAHSLGCYLVPKETAAKHIVLIGLPYWPGRSVLASVVLKLKSEIRLHRRDKSLGWWINKTIHNGWYIVAHLPKTYRGITGRKLANLPDGTKHKVILIRADDDSFCHPDAMKKLSPAKNYSFFKMPGAHDDCWLKPEPYVDLLLKEL